MYLWSPLGSNVFGIVDPKCKVIVTMRIFEEDYLERFAVFS